MASISKINVGIETYDIIPGGLAFDRYANGSLNNVDVTKNNCPNILLITPSTTMSTGSTEAEHRFLCLKISSVRYSAYNPLYTESFDIAFTDYNEIRSVPVDDTFSIETDSHSGIAYTPNIELRSFRNGYNSSSVTTNIYNFGFKNNAYRNIGIITVENGDYQQCLLGDTLITMADGSLKRIDEIVPGDEVLSVDTTNGEFFANPVVDNSASVGGTEGASYDIYTFDDGTVIKTTLGHLFYNVDLGRSVNIDKWELGQRGFTQRKTYAKLIGHEKVNEIAVGYNITCGKNYKKTNYFANGILCGDNKMNISKSL